jgi:hypothetical protein
MEVFMEDELVAEWPPRDNGCCEDKGKIDAFGTLLMDGGGMSPLSI